MAKRFLKGLPLLAVIAVLAFSVSGCATMTYNTSVTVPSDTELSADVLKIRKEIASYKAICGIGIGKRNYGDAVRKAVEGGKTIDVHVKNYVVYQLITAYSR